MAPLNTRSGTKTKMGKATETRRPVDNIRNSPSNCSIISVTRCGSDDLTDGKFTSAQIISDLRDKLANAQHLLADMETKYAKLKTQFKQIKELNITYTTQIEEQKNTLEILTNKIHSRTLTNISTQTVASVDTPGNQVNRQAETKQKIKEIPSNVNPPAGINDNNSKQPHVLLLSDSHGRNIVEGLKNNLQQQNMDPNKIIIDSIFKPNATFSQTCEDIRKLTKNLQKVDNVFVTAGTNDSSFSEFKNGVYKTLQNCQKSTLHITTVPYRFDKPEINNFIYDKNKFLFDLSLQYNFKLIDINLFLTKTDYTEHGLHLNTKGKHKLSNIFAEYLKNNSDFFRSSTSTE